MYTMSLVSVEAQNISVAISRRSGEFNSIVSPSGKYYASFNATNNAIGLWGIDRPYDVPSTVPVPVDTQFTGSPWSPVTYISDSVLVLQRPGTYRLLNLIDGSSTIVYPGHNMGCKNRFNSGWIMYAGGDVWKAYNELTNSFDTVATSASQHFSGALRNGEVYTRADRTLRVYAKNGSVRTEILLPDSSGASSLFQVLYDRGVAVSLSNDHLFVMSDTNKLIEYDLGTGAIVSVIPATFKRPGSIDVSPSGNRVFVATQGGEIALYDVSERQWLFKESRPNRVCHDPRFVNDTTVHVSSDNVDYLINTVTWKWTPITISATSSPIGICGKGKAFFMSQYVLDTRDSTLRDFDGAIMEMQGTDLLGVSVVKGPNDVRHKLYNRDYLYLVREYASEPGWKLMGCDRSGLTIIEASDNNREVRFRKLPGGRASQPTWVYSSGVLGRVKTLDQIDKFVMQRQTECLYFTLDDYKPIYEHTFSVGPNYERQPVPFSLNTAIDSIGGLWAMLSNDTCLYLLSRDQSEAFKAAIPFDVISYGSYGPGQCIFFGSKGQVLLLGSLLHVVDEWSLGRELIQGRVSSVSANESMVVIGYDNRFETVSLSRTTSVLGASSPRPSRPKAVAGTDRVTVHFSVRRVYDLQGRDCTSDFRYQHLEGGTAVTQVVPTVGVFVLVGENGDVLLAQFR